MPSPATIKLFRSRRAVTTPQIGSFEIIQNSAFIGYRTKIKWKYDDPNIVGFRIWRAVSPKVSLKKNYLVPQKALERLTGLKSFHSRNSALYNKQFFSENSKVKFFQSKSTRYTKPDETEEVETFRFQQVGFVKKNRYLVGGKRSSLYQFTDRRIKFGETYLYVISAITTGMFESKKSRSVTVRVEDLLYPDAPKGVKLSVVGSSIVVNIDVRTEAKDVAGFSIYRKEDNEKNFIKVADINADELNIVNWIDQSVIPGKAYTYKVYSKDFYGNLSFSAPEHRIRYDAIGFVRKGDAPLPEFDLKIDTGKVVFTGRKNSDEIVGYRIERKDVWRFEEKFEIKSFGGISWPNVNLFDESGSVELVDRSVTSGRVYQYRVTSIKKNSSDATFSFTPQIRIQDGFKFPEEKKAKEDDKKTDLLYFNTSIESVKQKPIFTKISWAIKGDWSYMLLDIKKGSTYSGASVVNPQTSSLKIDNVHEDNSIYFTDLELSNSYEIRAKVFDGEGNLLDESDDDQVTRITI